jgi:hypothetical protein
MAGALPLPFSPCPFRLRSWAWPWGYWRCFFPGTGMTGPCGDAWRGAALLPAWSAPLSPRGSSGHGWRNSPVLRSLPASVVGLCLGLANIGRLRRHVATNKVMTWFGIALSVLGVVFSIIGIVVINNAISNL